MRLPDAEYEPEALHTVPHRRCRGELLEPGRCERVELRTPLGRWIIVRGGVAPTDRRNHHQLQPREKRVDGRVGQSLKQDVKIMTKWHRNVGDVGSVYEEGAPFLASPLDVEGATNDNQACKVGKACRNSGECRIHNVCEGEEGPEISQ